MTKRKVKERNSPSFPNIPIRALFGPMMMSVSRRSMASVARARQFCSASTPPPLGASLRPLPRCAAANSRLKLNAVRHLRCVVEGDES